MIDSIQTWLEQSPANPLILIFGLSVAAYLLARFGIARFLHYLAARSTTKVDDTLLRHVRPYRLSWIAPLLVIYLLAPLHPTHGELIQIISLFLILWLSVVTLLGLLTAVNIIYESSKNYRGISIQSYLDILKIIIVIVAIILSVSLFSGQSPIVLLTGLGALTAVLLLIFQNTILSLVASVQIAAHDLLKEGDAIEVPSYEADGEVANISLHTIKIRNYDMTYSVIPTYKIIDVAFRNYRGIQDSGGRRIKRSFLVDMTTIKFCDDGLLAKLERIDLISADTHERRMAIEDYRKDCAGTDDSPLDGPQVTNLEIFRRYIAAYLKSRPDVYQSERTLVVRTLEPSPTGLPIEIYLFSRTTEWEKYEGIQSEISEHLLAAAPHFDLRVFQEPTGMDFSQFARAVSMT
jgi:miniconductance mechanosensitive channel